MKYNSLQQAVIGVLQEKKIKHPNQQAIDVHEPEKDEITADDFKKLRAGKKANEEAQQVDELSKSTLQSYVAKAKRTMGGLATNIRKQKDMPAKLKAAAKFDRREVSAHKALDRLANEDYTLEDFTDEELEAFLQSEEAQQLDELSYDTLNNYMKGRRKQINRSTGAGTVTGTGSKASEKLEKRIAGYRKAWKKRDMKEDLDPVQETLILHDSFNVELKDNYTFGDFLTAAKKLFGEELAIEAANTAFHEQDLEIFLEEISHSAVEDKINAHMKAGHKVSMPKYSTKDGKPRAEYVVTDKESGVRRKYIHQGNVTKMENMGARGKRDEK